MSPGFKCLIGQLRCGDRVGLGNTLFLDYAPVHMADRVRFSYGNTVITSTHDYDDFATIRCKPVVLEENVWVTCNVVILAGVRIGQNSVIGAGSVVTRDIPANVLAAGNPCRVVETIRRR